MNCTGPLRSTVLATLFCCSSLVLSGSAQTPAAGNDLSQLEAKAYAAYSAKNYAESARLYDQAIALTEGSARANDEYNGACSLALGGDKDRALAHLSQAVDDGWGDREHTSTDSDLTSLHGDPRFAALLDRMTTIQKAEDMRWGVAAFKSAYAPNLSDSDKVAGLSLLWAEAKFGFANFWHVPDLDWDATYRSYLPKVLATHSTAEYYDVLERFYALLKDGHTGVYPPEPLQTVTTPLETHLIDGRVLVTGLYPASFDAQGIKPGDELISVNNIPVQQWATEKVLPYVTASSPQDRTERLYYRGLLRGTPGTVFHLAFRTPAGKDLTRDFTVTQHGSPQPFEFRMLPGNIAYVALNEFEDNQDADEWDKHWSQISQAKAVILDLRRNGGGSTNIGYHVLATLIDKPVPGSRQVSPEWIATYRAWGNRQPLLRQPSYTVAPDPAHHFSGKVVMLTGPDTFSAAEDAVVLFATSKRGPIVGEASGGSTGQPLSFELPGGGGARVCTKHDSFDDGHEFVGVGVPPDIAAHITRDDLLHGTDSVLAAGVKAALQP